jgi:hypothetical protein
MIEQEHNLATTTIPRVVKMSATGTSAHWRAFSMWTAGETFGPCHSFISSKRKALTCIILGLTFSLSFGLAVTSNMN